MINKYNNIIGRDYKNLNNEINNNRNNSSHYLNSNSNLNEKDNK